MNELVVYINGDQKEVKFSDNSSVLVNSAKYHFEILQLDNDSYLLKIDNKFYEITAEKLENDIFSLTVNGKLLEVEVRTALQEKARRLLEEKFPVNHKVEIKAPMPGMILKVMKKAGEEIKIGEAVIILEAMKMENELRSPVSGILKELYIEEGSPVEKGIKLFVIEPKK